MIDWNFVTQRLATGAEIASREQAEYLAAHGVTHVVNCTGRDEADLLAHLPLTYLQCPTEDDGAPKPPDWFAPGVRFALAALQLADPPARVYVHCQLGFQRGPSMLYAVLRASGLPPTLAEDLIRSARPGVGIGYRADADRAVRHLGYEAENESYPIRHLAH